MKASYTFLLATGLAAQQVTATWDLFGSPFKSPQYNENECSEKQKIGFNWEELNDGDANFSYGDFDFSKNWKCSNSFGKRDALTKRSFGSKCIKNTISKEKPASFGCNKRKSGFSIREIDVSVEYDVDLEFHFVMKDGSKCKQVSRCNKSGSTVRNTQCGGAISVDVYLPKHEKTEKGCEIGFHNIGFDCDPKKEYSPPPPPPPPSPPKEVPSTSAPPATETAVSSGISQPPMTGTAPASCGGSYGESCGTTAVSLPVDPPYSNSSVPATDPAPPQTTLVTTHVESTTGMPPTVESSTAATCDGGYGGYGSGCNGTTAAPPQSTGYPVPVNSSIPVPEPSNPPSLPPANPTEVLPKCMNTWLQIDSECKDNTDASCYCKNKDFTKNVIDCVSAWCGTDEETREALQYLIGICAEHVPENPGLVTNCPTYVPLNPPTPTEPAVPEESTGGVITTAAPSETGAMETPCTTITYGSTTLTIPQVHFTTQTDEAGTNPTEPVGLVPGVVPAEAPASTTEGNVPVETGTTFATIAPTTTRLGTGTGAVGTTPVGTRHPEFTGAASTFSVEGQALLGIALALIAL